MRKISFAFLLTLFFSMVGNNAFAYDAEVDGIYYNFKGNEAIVTCYSSTSTYRYNKDGYNGDVVIPEKVTHNGKTYDVTSIESVHALSNTSFIYDHSFLNRSSSHRCQS